MTLPLEQGQEPFAYAMHYPFRTTPYAHQREVVSETWHKRNYALWWEMGCGKTWATLATAELLYANDFIDSMAVVAPKGVYTNWIGEIQSHLGHGVHHAITVWDPRPGKRRAAEMEKSLTPLNGVMQILLINVEALSTNRGEKMLYDFCFAHRPLLVIDESTSIKNVDGLRSKAISRIAPHAPFRRVLSGSPITQNPMDLYGQVAALPVDDFGRNILGFRSYYVFKNRYAITSKRPFGKVEMVMGPDRKLVKKKKNVDVVVGYRRLDELAKKLGAFSSRILKTDCLDLPAKIYEHINVDLSKDQLMYYALEVEKYKLDRADGKGNALETVLRLHQISCGFRIDEHGNPASIDNGRMKALLDLIAETQSKVIVWARFRHSIQSVVMALIAAYGQESAVHYYGDTTMEQREQAKVRFMNDPECRFFVANPQTGGYGLTLTSADTVIYYSNSFKLEERLQSEDRNHRIGQDSAVTYIDLIARGTVDEKIVAALRAKKEVADVILGEEGGSWI